MEVWTYTIISVVIISAVSLISVITLSLGREQLKKITLFLVSFAVGGLFGDAFIHLLPQAFREAHSGLATSLFVVLGILIFFVLEKFLRWRHCHIDVEESHHHPVVTMNIVSDGIHNFIDGVLVAASYSVSIPIGITTSIAVVLHEIPQEIADFGVLVHGGMSVRRALFVNFLCALTAVAGAIVFLLVGPYIKGFSTALVPITAGGFLYIAGSDLIPELQHDVKIKNSLIQFVCIIFGVAIMALMLLVEVPGE
jgi:zinc and cadmium transporter